MLTCKEITELATDFAEGHLAEAERRQFVAHLAGCHGCATWVRQLEATSMALGVLPEPRITAALQARLQDRFDAWAKERAAAGPAREAPRSSRARWRLTWTPALAIAAVFGLLVGLARSPSEMPFDWVVAVGLATVAAALVAFWRRVTLGFAAIAASSAVLAAVVTGGRGSLDGAAGLECLSTVGGVAALAAGAAWAVLRREPGEELGSAMGTWAVAGALASLAALQVACGTRSSLAHLLVFHVGGLLAVMALAHFATRLKAGMARG
jgi:putative zinc finger protein